MKKLQVILVVVASIALIAVGFLASRLLESGPEVTVSATSIEERLTRCSSLTTARLEYRGLVKYEEGDIPLINKKAFSMIYDAQISAGIDLGNAQVEVHGSDISITLPEPAIQDITIDPDSLEFYDEQFALFNWTGREDTVKAMDYAMEDAQAKTSQSDILAQAKEQAQTVIETLLAPVTEDGAGYTLHIQ